MVPYMLLPFVPLQKRYWLVGGVIWIYERILREVRSRHRTYISKVIQHPSKVMEIQIKKEKTTTRAGQYIFLCCPEVSYFQWHPFTLTRYVIFVFLRSHPSCIFGCLLGHIFLPGHGLRCSHPRGA